MPAGEGRVVRGDAKIHRMLGVRRAELCFAVLNEHPKAPECGRLFGKVELNHDTTLGKPVATNMNVNPSPQNKGGIRVLRLTFDPLLAPLTQGLNDIPQCATRVGELVLSTAASRARSRLHNTPPLERAEAFHQERTGHTWYASSDDVERLAAQQQIANHQQCPALAEDLLGEMTVAHPRRIH
jgi:hypothetical protein